MRGAAASAKIGNPNLFANLARYAIIGFAALIALKQLQIAPALLNELFGALVAAFGLAFGLGGQETARKWLNRGESSVSTAASQLQEQQNQPSTNGQIPTQQKPLANSQAPTQPERMRQPS